MDPQRRAYDPAERYYRLLDRCWPMNLVCGAELADDVDPAAVRAAWQATGRGLVEARTQADDAAGELVLGPTAVELIEDGRALDVVLQHELTDRFDPAGPLVRARLVSGDRPTLILTGQHAVADARALLARLRSWVAALGEAPGPADDTLPPGMHSGIRTGRRWPADRRDLLPVLRAAGEARRVAGPVAAYPAHPRQPEDHAGLPVVRITRLDDAATSRLVDRARADGTTVTGVLGSALLLSAAAHLEPTGTRLSLTVPADLRSRLDTTGSGPALAVTLVTTTHDVGSTTPEALARAVTADVGSALDTGLGELFYALAAPGRTPLDADGDARTRAAIAEADDGLTLSNVGVLPAARHGPVVERCWFSLPPTPNQLAFVSATTHDGRLTLVVASTRLDETALDAWWQAALGSVGLRP